MPLWLGVLSFVFTGFSFFGMVICQRLIIRRLKGLNGGKVSPLVSEYNEHTSRFSHFLTIIDEEPDRILRLLKKWNKILWNASLLFFFISIIIAIQIKVE